jgi:hypothetical protein
MIDLTMRRSKEDVTLAMIGHFNHMISVVEMPDGSMKYLDGTADFHPFDIIPEYDSDAQVVIIKDDKGIVTRTPATKPENNVQRKTMKITLTDDGSAKADVTMFYNGSWEPYVRRKYEQSGKVKQEIEKFYTSKFPESSISDIDFFDVYNMDEPVEYKYKVKIKNFAQKSNNELIVLPVLSPEEYTQDESIQYPERKFDILLNPPNINEYIVEIHYPENYEIANDIKSIKFETKYIDLKCDVTVSPNCVTLKYNKIVKYSRIRINEYQNWRKIAENYDEIERLKLRFQKKG